MSKDLYRNDILISCGIAAGGTFLTRAPSSLPSAYNPVLYYGFFSIITFVPLILGLVRMWKKASVKNRREQFLGLLLILFIVIIASLLYQWSFPTHQLIKAFMVIALTVVGVRLLIQRQERTTH